MNILVYSGGGSEIASIAGASDAIVQNDIHYDMIVGVNAGAVVALITALEYNASSLLEETSFFSHRSKNPYKHPWVTTALFFYNLLFAKSSLWDNSWIRNVYSQIITEKDFEEYLDMYHTSQAPEVGVMTVNVDTGAMVMNYAHRCTYTEWIDLVVASCSTPVFYAKQKVETTYHVDGSIRAFTPTMALISDPSPIAPENMSSVTEVFARDAFYPDEPFFSTPPRTHNIVQAISFLYFVMSRQIAVLGAFYTDLWMKKNKVLYKAIYVGGVLKHPWDYNKDRMRTSYEMAKRKMYKHLNPRP